MIDVEYHIYDEETPYAKLGISVEKGLKATAREIGKFHRRENDKARRIKDTKERARRTAELREVRDLLIRPDDRVKSDFFCWSKMSWMTSVRTFRKPCYGRKSASGNCWGSTSPNRNMMTCYRKTQLFI